VGIVSVPVKIEHLETHPELMADKCLARWFRATVEVRAALT